MSHRDFIDLRGRDVTFDLVMRNGKHTATNLTFAATYFDKCVLSLRIMGTIKKFDEKQRCGFFGAPFLSHDICFFTSDLPLQPEAALGTTALIGKSAVFSVIFEEDIFRAQWKVVLSPSVSWLNALLQVT